MRQNNSFRKIMTKQMDLIIFLIIFCVFPFIVKTEYLQRTMTEIFFIGAMASAWNIIGGFANQTSWAHASFLAVGAYTSFTMYMQVGMSPLISMFVGVVFAVILAIIIGWPTFKLRGIYFVIATIACATIVRQLLLYPSFSGFTGGANGLILPALQKDDITKLYFSSEIPYYYIVLVFLIITLVIVDIIVHSRLGYYLRAIREDEDAAESLGIKPHQIKLIALIISASLMSILGTLYAFKIKYIDPQSVASHEMAVRIGITAIIGGLGTKWGPVVGSFVTIILLEVANFYFGALGGGGVGFVIYGLLMVLVVMFEKNGLIGVLGRIKKFVFSKFKKRNTGENM